MEARREVSTRSGVCSRSSGMCSLVVIAAVVAVTARAIMNTEEEEGQVTAKRSSYEISHQLQKQNKTIATTMAKALTFLLIVYLFLAALMMASSTVVGVSVDQGFSWVPAKARCQGSIAECMAEDEFDIDSKINRCILTTTQYISYAALQRNSVPCSQKGTSYYNCQQVQRQPLTTEAEAQLLGAAAKSVLPFCLSLHFLLICKI